MPYSTPSLPALAVALACWPGGVSQGQSTPAFLASLPSQQRREQLLVPAEKKQPLTTVLQQIKVQYGVSFFYHNQALDKLMVPASLPEFKTWEEKLQYVLKLSNLQVEKLSATVYVLSEPAPLSAQTQTIAQPISLVPTSANAGLQDVTVAGRVVDAKGAGLPGVTVVVKGTSIGTGTGADGSFTIQAPENSILVFSFVGFTRKEVPITGATSNLAVTLAEDTQALSEVVVVGYGEQKKETLTGAIATVDQKIFQNRGVVDNPLAALQGVVPGVIVTRTAAAPGRANWNFQIRGASSVNGSSPLIVVDGVALSDQNALNTINPNDIDNISFLKDASAAIYGARAAGGVVLITTKRAKAGKVTVQYDGSVSQKRIGLQPQLLNRQQFGQGLIDATTNDNYGVPRTDYIWYKMGVAMTNPPASGYLDKAGAAQVGFNDVNDLPLFDNSWVDVLWGRATSTQHNLSVSGRGDKAGYRVSLGYLKDNSLLKWGNNSNTRYNIRLTHDYQFTDKFKLETNLSLERNDVIQPTLVSSVLGQYQQPGFPVNTINGKAYSWGTQYSPNAQAELGGDTKETNNRIFTNFRLSYDFNKHLRAVSTLGYNWALSEIASQQKSIQWYNYTETIQAADNPTRQNTFYARRTVRDAYANLNGFLEYTNTFAENHAVGVTAGVSYERDEYRDFRTQTNFLASDLVPSLNLGIGDATTRSNTESQNHYAIGSYFSRINYAYRQKYLLEANLRYDGTSKFNAANRWKFFYGLSGGWRVSEEGFMKNVSFLNELKLRGSYGVLGNQNGIGLYDYIQTLSVTATSGQTSSGFPILGANPAVLVGPTSGLVSLNRTWEKVETSNVGLDFSVLNRRLSISGDYFIKHNRNMLLDQTYPAVLGATAPKANIGHLKTWGWEASLQWQDKVGGVNYRFGGSITDNQNRLINYGGAKVINAGYNTAVEGSPIGSYFGLEYAGRIQTEEQLAAYRKLAVGNNIGMPITSYNADGSVNPKAPGVRLGDNMFKDLNGDGKLTTDDLKYIGRDDPRYSFSFNLGADWKGFDFNAIFQGVGERTIFRTGDWRVPFGSIFQGQTNFWYGNTWTPENTNAYYPNLSANTNGVNYNNYNYYASTWSVQNGAYLRLKNLVAGYTLPQSISKRAGLERVRVYYAGSDLWETTKIKDGWDPEASRLVGRDNNNSTPFERYPFFRLHTLGVNLTL
ncbi:TonB-dependent receptor [Hymenobacter sp. GOD-10R]|uniref:SusC/RagA family TonB-linked outer membrane protein n=1 Tax=Hymenobacter sp. GOD-10R TaxID=3093922 RepID=UPI002D764EFD|nr:TonB-dependent receptor [Hymenobacter sp. GOD-10R]WRQ31890.1 TonB-dependent receptor [Hymenobacter sp. GOD-10R]